MRFDQFMREALYAPERGYYRRNDHDPFGVDGDFFTASQLQPFFGRLIAGEANALAPGEPFYELGPGRREMAPHFGARYQGIDIGDELPPRLEGFVFANEFFDALPVRLGIRQSQQFRELVVEEGSPELQLGPPLDEECRNYIERYWPVVSEGGRFEIGMEALSWIDRLAARLESGYLLAVDYGYTTEETVRFPQGTLGSYQRHRFSGSSILDNPGTRDITAHVAFDALRERAERRGFECQQFETLAQMVIRALERDPSLAQGCKERQQLKTVLFGMGETFRCLLLRKLPPK